MDSLDQTLSLLASAASEPELDVESLTPAIVQMVSRGVSPEGVSALLGISVGHVRRVSVTTRSWLGNDAEMADNMRHLLSLAYGRALEVFELGPQAEQAALTRLLLAYALKSISGESTSQFDEIRGEFENMLSGMRNTKDVNNGSGTGPSFVDAFDTDEGFDD